MSKQIKVAIFALGVLVVSFFGAKFLGGKGLFDSNSTYYAIFDKVAGMNNSDPVTVNGYQVGKVGGMKLIDSGKHRGKIAVDLIIRDDIKLPTNSKAVLFSADLLGAMNVKILLSDSMSFHGDEDTIFTDVEGSMFEEIGGELTPLTDKLGTTMDNVNELFDFEKTDNVQSLNYTIENLNKTMATFQQSGELLNAQLDSQLKAIDRILANVEKTTEMVNSNEENITVALQNVKDLTTTLKALDLQNTLNNVDGTVTELQSAVAKINSTDNSMGALLNEKELYDNLEESTKNLELLLLDMRMNPSRYIHFSVFGGKAKNQPAPVTE